jgi:hypothetical protein
MSNNDYFEEALQMAGVGAFRTPEEMKAWAVDYLAAGGGGNVQQAVTVANYREAERKAMAAQAEIDNKRCVELRQELYFEDAAWAGLSCKRDPSQLTDLQTKHYQLGAAVVAYQYRLKNRSEYYSPLEAEAMARAELGLPKVKSGIAGASDSGLPNLYGKTKQEVEKIACDLGTKKTTIPSVYGKTKAEIDEELKKL